jgi:hypothetical protein
LVGITPGMTQVRAAWVAVKGAIASNRSYAEGLAAARQTASFDGMRKTIAGHLDALGVAEALDIPSTSAIFSNGMAQACSSLRYPVFRAGKNYPGYGPGLLDAPMFRTCIETMLAAELRASPRALIIPFGRSVDEAIGHLIRRGGLDEDRVLRGFPHPSPANGHRARIFAENQSAMRKVVERWFGAR